MTTEQLLPKSTTVEAPVLELITKRKSRRAYQPRVIQPEVIQSLFEAARWAPSSNNEQPWVYIYATKDQPELWGKLFEAINPWNQIWAKDAPLLVLCLVRKNFQKTGKPNPSARYDLGAANAFLSLQATELGLNVHQMGGYYPEKAIELLNISEAYEPVVMMAIGYLGAEEQLTPELQARENAPRERNTREAFVMNKGF
jgi:nitroreductase